MTERVRLHTNFIAQGEILMQLMGINSAKRADRSFSSQNTHLKLDDKSFSGLNTHLKLADESFFDQILISNGPINAFLVKILIPNARIVF